MSSIRRQFKWGLLAITLLGAFFRFPGLFENTFAADEALFAMWARYIATWRDPLLFNVPTAVDKPPLLFYLQGLFYPLQGPVEWAARLPNFLSSIMLIPLVGIIACELTKGNLKRSLLASAIVAFSPMAMQFSATAYTDPLLTFLVTVAVWHSVRNRELPQKSALWLGIAFWAKYQAVLFVPLIWLLLWGHKVNKWNWDKVFRWSAVFGGCLTALFVWDAVSGSGIDLVSRQVSSYGGVALTPAAEWLPRLHAWGNLFTFVPGFVFVWAFPPFFVVFLLFNRQVIVGYQLANRYLLGFVIYFLLFHWLVNIQPWDRYLLPLVPVFALWVVTIPRRLVSYNGKVLETFALLALAILFLVLQAMPARVGGYPVGGRPDNDDGAAAIAQTIIDEP
ncbi:MAG: glycosyltransferase family 39 protein, partial [Chloroflexota bacterium]